MAAKVTEYAQKYNSHTQEMLGPLAYPYEFL